MILPYFVVNTPSALFFMSKFLKQKMILCNPLVLLFSFSLGNQPKVVALLAKYKRKRRQFQFIKGQEWKQGDS